jgi:asparagine synthase (glutamine-hydrolysing)
MSRFTGVIHDDAAYFGPDVDVFEGCRVLWRGYIANREEITAEAERRGMHVGGDPEGHLFASAYRCWGKDLSSHVLGQYCVAIFDDETSTALLTHDALGLVPLFWRRTPGNLLFATHIEDLLAVTGTHNLDEEFIADHIANASFSSRRTPYRGIERLEPNTSVLCTPRGLKEVRGRGFGPAKDVRDEGCVHREELLALLEEGVRTAIRATGPVWCELSGGLDSSTVLSMATRDGTADLGAFSIVYKQYADADEAEWIRLVLERFPVPWHVLDGDCALPYSEVPDRFCPEPGLHLVDWAGRRVYEEMAAAHGVAAVLTGQGGDLVFLGIGAEPYHLADLARTLRFRGLFAEMERWRSRDRTQRSRLYWLVNYVMRPLVSRVRGRPVLPPWHREPSPWIHPEYARKMGLRDRGSGRAAARGGTVERAFLIERLSALCAQIAYLNQIPRSFEFRHPLLYQPLVEFMLSLPSEEKYDPSGDRPLQRAALAGVLPDAVRLRGTKTIYDQPCYEGLRQGRSFVRLLTEDPLVVKRGIVDRNLWIEAVAQARMGLAHSLPQFEAVASLEIWLRQLEDLEAGRFTVPESPLTQVATLSNRDLQFVIDRKTKGN